MQVRNPIRTAVGLTLFQIVLFYLVSGAKVHTMINWDAQWYRDIALHGYSVSTPLKHEYYGGDNIAFFPAYPVLVSFFIHVLGANPDWSVFLASQLVCVFVWIYFMGLLKQLEVRTSLGWLVCGLFLIQPGAFYHVVGYSESLFTASLLGFVYWCHRAYDRDGKIHWAATGAAIFHGGVLSSTRFLGVVLCGYPVLLALARGLRALSWATITSVLGLWGFASYLTYCQVRWGSWNLYWEANRVGWNVYFDPWKLVSWSYYRDVYFFGNLSEVLGRQFTLLTLIASIGLVRWTYKNISRTAAPFALSLLSLGFILETIVGSHGMHSMIRYLVPIDALFFPLGALWWEFRLREKKATDLLSSHGQWIALAGCSLIFFALQILFAIRYSRSDWVS